MQLKSIIEGALLAAGRPLTLAELGGLFDEGSRPAVVELQAAIAELGADCTERGVELCEVASGWRLQVRRELAPWIARMSEEKPPRYSRALLETLAIIAYRQPLTRADIEEVRGVAVNPNIIRTLQEREWVRVIGHRDVPGRPELLATTRQFLDYFGLRGLENLPALSEIKDFEHLDPAMPLAIEGAATTAAAVSEGAEMLHAAALARDVEAWSEARGADSGDASDDDVPETDPWQGDDAFVEAEQDDTERLADPDAEPRSAP